MNENNLREPFHAGSFYPENKKDLNKMIEGFLKNDFKKIKGNLKALIVPHAGYVYSGIVAASAYSALKESKKKNIILFGPSHYTYLEGAYAFCGKWKTPLGEVKVNSADLPLIKNDSEHSLEVQVPFLQTVVKESKLIFTPIIYGDVSFEELADIINTEKKEDSVLIASSDLSHYLSYSEAKKTDSNTINSILAIDLEKFSKEGDACGKNGIGALIILAKKNKWKTILLDYKNSGDTKGNKDQVVGYSSIAFIEEKK